jgi:hypothetical protein
MFSASEAAGTTLVKDNILNTSEPDSSESELETNIHTNTTQNIQQRKRTRAWQKEQRKKNMIIIEPSSHSDAFH